MQAALDSNPRAQGRPRGLQLLDPLSACQDQQMRRIVSNTGDELTLDALWVNTPDNMSKYSIETMTDNTAITELGFAETQAAARDAGRLSVTTGVVLANLQLTAGLQWWF